MTVPDMIRIAAPGVTRDQVTELGWELDWVFEDLVGGNEQPAEKIWLTVDEESAIHFIEDHVLDIPYLAIEGRDKDDIARSIRETLPTLDVGDVEQLVDEAEDEDEWIEAIYKVAASTSGELDPRLFALYERALGHEDPEVRRAAVYAMAYPAWREFRPLLERLAADDESSEVRDYARKMIDELESRYWGD